MLEGSGEVCLGGGERMLEGSGEVFLGGGLVALRGGLDALKTVPASIQNMKSVKRPQMQPVDREKVYQHHMNEQCRCKVHLSIRYTNRYTCSFKDGYLSQLHTQGPTLGQKTKQGYPYEHSELRVR